MIIPSAEYDMIIITGACGSGKTTLAEKIAAISPMTRIYCEDKVFAEAIKLGRMSLEENQELRVVQDIRYNYLAQIFATNCSKIVCDIHLHTIRNVELFLQVVENVLTKQKRSHIKILFVKLAPTRTMAQRFIIERMERLISKKRGTYDDVINLAAEIGILMELDEQRRDFQEVLNTPLQQFKSQAFSISELTVSDPTAVLVR